MASPCILLRKLDVDANPLSEEVGVDGSSMVAGASCYRLKRPFKQDVRHELAVGNPCLTCIIRRKNGRARSRYTTSIAVMIRRGAIVQWRSPTSESTLHRVKQGTIHPNHSSILAAPEGVEISEGDSWPQIQRAATAYRQFLRRQGPWRTIPVQHVEPPSLKRCHLRSREFPQLAHERDLRTGHQCCTEFRRERGRPKRDSRKVSRWGPVVAVFRQWWMMPNI